MRLPGAIVYQRGAGGLRRVTRRAAVLDDQGGQIAGEGGADVMIALHDECLAVAAASGQPVPAAAQATARDILTAAGSPMKASMLRDLEAGQRVEAAHIVGDMVHRAGLRGIAVPRLHTAWVHLQAYERLRTP